MYLKLEFAYSRFIVSLEKAACDSSHTDFAYPRISIGFSNSENNFAPLYPKTQSNFYALPHLCIAYVPYFYL